MCGAEARQQTWLGMWLLRVHLHSAPAGNGSPSVPSIFPKSLRESMSKRPWGRSFSKAAKSSCAVLEGGNDYRLVSVPGYAKC